MIFELSRDEERQFSGTIKAPPSKSYMHRLIVASSLCQEETKIYNYGISEDVMASLRAIKKLGGDFSLDEALTISPIKRGKVRATEINCNESGTTFRFLVPLGLALGEECSFCGKGRLPERPLSPLKEELEKNGAVITELSQGKTLPLKCSGSLRGGIFNLPGNISSQFVSGLLFALPILNEDSEIRISLPFESKPYVNMTIKILSKFGIKISEETKGETLTYKINGCQAYASPREIFCEGDWSQGAFFLCGGAISGDIRCENLSLSSLQGDKEIYSLLKKMGAKIESGKGYVKIKKSRLKAIDIDASQIPDLVPILALVLSLSEGEGRIFNAQRLRLKESDRLSSTMIALRSLGADIKETEDGLEIKGKPCLEGGRVSSFNDHRIAMMEAISSLGAKGSVLIEEPMCVRKSYPNFYEDFVSLGGKKYVVNMGK